MEFNSSDLSEPDTKRLKFTEIPNTTTTTVTESPIAIEGSMLIGNNVWQNSDIAVSPNVGSVTVATLASEKDTLRLSYMHLKRESEKKDYLIQDLLKKLNEALETIKAQADQIAIMTKNNKEKLYQRQQQEQQSPPDSLISDDPNSTQLLSAESRLVASAVIDLKNPVPSLPPEFRLLGQPVELRIIQQPPSQAVYQRILRPFPTVAIFGVNPKQYASFFIEVSLLKKSTFEDGHDTQYVTWYKNNTNANNGNTANNSVDKEKNLLGGQLVQRSEPGSTPNSLVVVFRKLKVLTTSAQQGAFFVLRFSLKRYVDNVFEPVGGVQSVISTPIEVFSHTLYLKGRPSSSPKEPKAPKTTPNVDFSTIQVSDTDPMQSLSLAAASEQELENTNSTLPVLANFTFGNQATQNIMIENDNLTTIPTESATVTYQNAETLPSETVQ